MAEKCNNKFIETPASTLIVHSRDLVGDLSRVISLSATPEQVNEIRIVLPSLKFMIALMDLDTSNESINIVTDAWSIGLSTSIIVHQKLLPLLSANKLHQLPVSLKDHKGFELCVICKEVISYADVALLNNAWLLTNKNIITTRLAFEHIQKNALYIVEQ